MNEQAEYVAQRYVAPEGAEVLGMALVGYFDNLASHQLDPVLERYGFSKETFDPQGWYPMQTMFDLVVEANPHDDHTVAVALGKAVAETMLFVLDVPDTTRFIETYIQLPHEQFHRNIPEGYGYLVTKLDEGHYYLKNNTPHSTSGFYGYLWEALRRLTDGKFTLRLLDSSDFVTDRPATFEVMFTP